MRHLNHILHKCNREWGLNTRLWVGKMIVSIKNLRNNQNNFPCVSTNIKVRQPSVKLNYRLYSHSLAEFTESLEKGYLKHVLADGYLNDNFS